MATLRKRYVDPDVSGGAGDGTSWANAYASLNAAEQAEDNSGNIAGSDEYVEFVCGHNGAAQTTADTTACNIVGWTTDATRYIHVYTEAADRHAGIWDDNKYRLHISNVSGISMQENYVRIEGLQISIHSQAANGKIGIFVPGGTIDASNDLRVSHCLIKQATQNDYWGAGIYTADADAVVTIWNCIVYGLGTANSTDNSCISLSCATGNVYGCTLIGGYYGLRRASGTVNAKNVYAANTAGADFSSSLITKTNCASEDTSAGSSDGCVSSVAYTTTNFESVTAGESTYLKVKSGGALHEAGTTLSDDPPGSSALSVDIAGNSRS